MSGWTYATYRWPDQAAWIAARALQGWTEGTPPGVDLLVVGQLYVDSPTRVCNAYLLDDQEQLGHWLVWLAVAIAVAWLAWMFYAMVRRDEALQAPDRVPELPPEPVAEIIKR